jgi:hypothetical protein
LKGGRSRGGAGHVGRRCEVGQGAARGGSRAGARMSSDGGSLPPCELRRQRLPPTRHPLQAGSGPDPPPSSPASPPFAASGQASPPATARSIPASAGANYPGRCATGCRELLETLHFCLTKFLSHLGGKLEFGDADWQHCWRWSKGFSTPLPIEKIGDAFSPWSSLYHLEVMASIHQLHFDGIEIVFLFARFLNYEHILV